MAQALRFLHSFTQENVESGIPNSTELSLLEKEPDSNRWEDGGGVSKDKICQADE